MTENRNDFYLNSNDNNSSPFIKLTYDQFIELSENNQLKNNMMYIIVEDENEL